MKAYAKNATLKRVYIAIAAVCCLIGCALALGGCGKGGSFAIIAPSEITMYVGEERNLLPYIDIFPDGDRDSVQFSSSDEGIIEISGSVAWAKATGSAVVTARSNSGEASISVAVEYRKAGALRISCDGNAVQNIGDLSNAEPVAFSVATDDYVDPDEEIQWCVDGKPASAGDEFMLTPTRFGEFAVAAKLGDLTEVRRVAIYRETEARGEYEGELEQLRDYTPVLFSAWEVIDTRNPLSLVIWTVNGETASTGKTFRFVPTASGEYKIELTVNGVKRKIGGRDEVVVRAIGERAPSARVAFDADGVYVQWADGGRARSVIVTDPSGVRTSYSSSDAAMEQRFGDGVFDATGIIEVTADRPATYTIAVSGSALGDAVEFTQYGEDAKEFIQNKILVNNAFIDGEARARELALEAYACGKTSVRAYLARGADGDKLADIVETTFGELGVSSVAAVDGNILSVETDEYDNAPTVSVDPISDSRIYSVLPHIEYNASDRRADGYALAVDRIKRVVRVKGTEQLLYAVMSGCKPIPESGDVAERVFDNARRTLMSVIGKDYDDFTKIHAIYDYLQWTGNKAPDSMIDDKHVCNYLESLFYAGSGRPSYMVTSLGASKALALLCGMEGIEADIVAIERGEAYYYINVVTVDNVRYIVDVYGGEYETSEYRGLSTHERLLIDDRTARALGIFGDDFSCGAIDGGAGYYLQKHADGDIYYDHYIAPAEKTDFTAIKTAVVEAFDNTKKGDIRIFSITGTTTVPDNQTAGAEFFADFELPQTEVDAVERMLLRAANEYAQKAFGAPFRDGAVKVRRAGRILYLTATLPKASS